MKRTSYIYNVLAMAIALIALSGCHHKDLCYMHPHVTKLRVVYDWSEAPEANPAGMRAFFYSVDEPGRYHTFDFPGAKGGEIELPAGEYVLVTYNNDTEAVRFSSTNSFDNHYAQTRTGDILEPMYGNGVTSTATTDNGERVVICPDQLWGCSVTQITITQHGVTYIHEHSGTRAETYTDNGDQIITLYPHDMLCHYTYEVRNVKNANHISQISAALSGMSPGMNLSTETLDAEHVTLPFEANANATANTITGSFLTFGHNPDNTASHRMSFYVVMDDGSKYTIKAPSNLDVTDQVDNAPDRRHVHIIIDGLDLPDTNDTGTGFNPWVDDWGVIEEDLDI